MASATPVMVFVAHEYVVQGFLVVVQGIVGGHYGTTGISEEHVHALVFEGAHKGFSTCYLCCFHIFCHLFWEGLGRARKT